MRIPLYQLGECENWELSAVGNKVRRGGMRKHEDSGILEISKSWKLCVNISIIFSQRKCDLFQFQLLSSFANNCNLQGF